MNPPSEKTEPLITLDLCQQFLLSLIAKGGIKGAAIVLDFEDPSIKSVGLWKTKDIDIRALVSLVSKDAQFHSHLTTMLAQALQQAAQENQ